MTILKTLKTSLDQLNIKTKLLLFMALPFLVVIFLGIIQIQQHYRTYSQAKLDSQFIEISLALESLIVELQKERGLTEFYIAAPSPLFQQKIKAQRTHTNIHVDKFELVNKNVQHVNQLSPLLADNDSVQKKFSYINNLINHLGVIRKKVDSGEPHSPFQFYSTLIAGLIDIIENLEMTQSDSQQSRLARDSINLLWLIEYSGQERGALNGILGRESLDINELQQVLNYISAQDENIKRFLSTASHKYQLAMNKVLSSSEHSQILEIRDKIQQKIKRDALISELKSIIGFSGIIHNFKDYIATGQSLYLQHVQSNLALLNALVLTLEEGYLINQQDSLAVNEIKTLANQIESAISPSNNANSAFVKTLPQAFNEIGIQQAISHLQRGKLDIHDTDWWQLTTNRLEKIRQINKQIQQRMVKNAKQIETSSIAALFLNSVLIVSTLIVSFILSYFISKRVVGEIRNITKFMKRIKEHHHFNQQITLTGDDEITQIERAYNELLVERQQSEHITRISAAVFEHASEAILISNADNIIEEVNPAFTEITGFQPEEVIGKTPSAFKSGRHEQAFYDHMWQEIQTNGQWQGEIWNKRKNGEIFPEYLAISVVKDQKGKVLQHIALFSDISKHKQYEQDIWYQANYDALTNLPNRNLLINRLAHEVDLVQRNDAQLAVLFIDLDRFKYVNDSYGHSYGDELIITIAQKFTKCLRKSDTIARLGGDEFVVLMPNVKQITSVERVASTLLKSASEPITLSNGHQAIVSASVGISIFPNDAQDAESLLKNADTAMYQAKELGKDTFCFFTTKMNHEVAKRMQLDIELRKAITNQEFCLHYQPVLDLTNNQIVGVEALVRWQHPTEGLIYPDTFIGIAEDTGLIVDIGRQVLNQAVADLKKIHQAGFNIHVAVNVSARQCVSSNFPITEDIAAILSEFDIPPKYLNIEITESMLIENTEQTKCTLQSIKDLGVDIYLDDFGTGYSSLSYLKQFPIDVLKIDRCFILKMLEDESDANLVKAIIEIGRSLKLDLVAEGVESEQHLDHLLALGCDFIQGYHVSKPIAFDQLMCFLRENDTV